MKIQELTIGLKIRHPQYGFGLVKKLDEHTAEIRFDDVLRSVDPELSGITPAEPIVSATGLDMPLKQFVESIVQGTVAKLGIEKSDVAIDQLGLRWNGGKAVMHPSDPTLQTKEVPLETFFHKIVILFYRKTC
jgi:hypothetical protein